MEMGISVKDLYPPENDFARFEFLCIIFRRGNKAMLRGYISQIQLLSVKYPYMEKILNTFEMVFDNKYPFGWEN